MEKWYSVQPFCTLFFKKIIINWILVVSFDSTRKSSASGFCCIKITMCNCLKCVWVTLRAVSVHQVGRNDCALSWCTNFFLHVCDKDVPNEKKKNTLRHASTGSCIDVCMYVYKIFLYVFERMKTTRQRRLIRIV